MDYASTMILYTPITVAGLTRTVLVVHFCCRDGMKRGHAGANKTGKIRKHHESRKIEQYYLSRMIITEYLKERKVHVHYILTHTNHDLSLQECKHLSLPPSIKADIQQQFAEGVLLERIIDSKLLKFTLYPVLFIYLKALKQSYP